MTHFRSDSFPKWPILKRSLTKWPFPEMPHFRTGSFSELSHFEVIDFEAIPFSKWPPFTSDGRVWFFNFISSRFLTISSALSAYFFFVKIKHFENVLTNNMRMVSPTKISRVKLWFRLLFWRFALDRILLPKNWQRTFSSSTLSPGSFPSDLKCKTLGGNAFDLRPLKVWNVDKKFQNYQILSKLDSR